MTGRALLRAVLQAKGQTGHDVLILVKLGRFYKTAGLDAQAVAKTCRTIQGVQDGIPVTEFAAEECSRYLARLVKAGHRVALCEKHHEAPTTVCQPQLELFA